MRTARGESGNAPGAGASHCVRKIAAFRRALRQRSASDARAIRENRVRTAQRADILSAMSICTSVLGRAGPGLLLAFDFLLASCGEAPKQPPAPPPPKVTVAPPVQRTILDQDEYVGRFVAVDTVEVRARVSGYLDKVHFQDGQQVKQGDLLFTIDKRPFQNTLAQARANLALARSNLEFTEADLARGKQLLRDRTISEQVFDQRNQAFRNAQASVAANEAMVRQAELDLE